MASTSVTIKDYRELPGSIEGLYYLFPTITSFNRNGREIFWRIKIGCSIDDNETRIPIDPEWLLNKKINIPLIAIIEVESGIVGGKIKDASPTFVRTGKNIGRSNETNVFCQALRDALGKYNKQLRGATHEGNVDIMLPPMLATVYKPGSLAGQTVFVQKKYNGVRAVITLDKAGNVFIYSRGNKSYAKWPALFEEVHDQLKKHDGLYIDGEIYKPGMPLQLISGKVRKGDYSGLKFYAYDVFFGPNSQKGDKIQSERLEFLKNNFAGLNNLVIADTFEATGDDEVKIYYENFLKEGYEGAIVRKNAKYIFSYNKYRADSLIKIKPTFDGEYKIIGFTQGSKGKALGALMIICETGTGYRFDVTPTGEIEERKKLYKKFIENDGDFENNWLGKMLIVNYDETSIDGVPQRARTDLLVRSDDNIWRIN